MKICPNCKIGKPLTEYNKAKKRADGYQGWCRVCTNAKNNWYYANNPKYKDRIQKNNKESRERNVSWFREYKSNLSCTECGESHPATLDFHHTDPTIKEGDVSALARNNNRAALLAEIEKCIVLCSNCHRKEHWTGS